MGIVDIHLKLYDREISVL